jgi:hypothetical protein
VLRKPSAFPNATVEVLSASPGPASPAPIAPNATVKFRLPQSSAKAVAFLNGNPGAQKIVQFNPNGQARTSGSLAQMIEVGIKPMKGASPDEGNVAAIQVSGLTGQTQVYRR